MPDPCRHPSLCSSSPGSCVTDPACQSSLSLPRAASHPTELPPVLSYTQASSVPRVCPRPSPLLPSCPLPLPPDPRPRLRWCWGYSDTLRLQWPVPNSFCLPCSHQETKNHLLCPASFLLCKCSIFSSQTLSRNKDPMGKGSLPSPGNTWGEVSPFPSNSSFPEPGYFILTLGHARALGVPSQEQGANPALSPPLQ